jgi:hypothetical protein
MKTIKTTGAARRRRLRAHALLLACSALACMGAAPWDNARAQSLFPSSSSTLPSLSQSQFGTAGTATATTGAQYGSTAGTAGTLRPSLSTDTGTDTGTGTGTAPNAAATDGAAFSGAAAAQQQSEPEDLNQTADDALDPGAQPVEEQPLPRQPVDPTGIRVGSFLLRPSISQNVNTEITRSAGEKQNRDYLTTGIRGNLQSDWSRHSLTVNGEVTLERNYHGGARDLSPEGRLNADLRLDLSDQTTAHITAGYSFIREENDDPNAIGGAAEQAGVHEYDAGASIERAIGKVHALAALDASRFTYTDSTLTDGTTIDNSTRDRTGIDGRLRLGYEVSPALIPYVEVAAGHTFYDSKFDLYGYERSSQNYAARTGVQFDFGEKLRGELGTGYQLTDYDDSRLANVGGLTFNGKLTWSPHRGTTIDTGLRTTVQDATVPGESGWVEYQLTSALAYEMRDNLIGRLTAGATYRDFSPTIGDDVTWLAGTGLTWNINRYLDLTGDLEYEWTTGSTQQNILRAGVGLTLKR